LRIPPKLISLLFSSIALSACTTSVLEIDQKAFQPVPSKLVAEMNKRSMSKSSPVLIRIFKQESELEIWKQDKSGRYALLKTYPMCRWSGRLGPKKANGDRQAPEGFYHVAAGMLNPKSQYYLSFNLGYPNRLETALGYTGEALMVHGACSSSGCFALTDEGVAEIYAVVREALRGGQERFQVQSFPFRMTSENFARHAGDPNMPFWLDLKRGHDLFELDRQPPEVGYCARRYVFAANGAASMPTEPLEACPAKLDPPLERKSLVAVNADRAPTDTLDNGVVSAIGPTYADGGMHASFRSLLRSAGHKKLASMTSVDDVPVSRPDDALLDPFTP
jgi:murein L,D-transpeptidase YafK